ncbi:hypothetical protein BGZ59_004346, partial [Podila verticillata]
MTASDDVFSSHSVSSQSGNREGSFTERASANNQVKAVARDQECESPEVEPPTVDISDSGQHDTLNTSINGQAPERDRISNYRLSDFIENQSSLYLRFMKTLVEVNPRSQAMYARTRNVEFHRENVRDRTAAYNNELAG